MKQKGINMNLWSAVIFILIAFIMVLFGTAYRSANLYVQKQTEIEENRRMCEEESQKLSDSSDYLTDEVFHFVATGDVKHLNNYWYEVEQEKSRDKSIEHLAALSLTAEEQSLVENAKQASDKLVQNEAWAMRLTADSIGMEMDELPERVAAIQYTPEEESLTPGQKGRLASQYVFGREYTDVKKGIKDNLNSFRILLRDRKDEELKSAVSQAEAALGNARSLMFALIAAFIVEAVLFYQFIMSPFNHYTHALWQMNGNGFTALTPRGAKGTRAFAIAFNKIYSEWSKQKEHLEEERYRFHVALDNTSIIVYEYDPVSDTYMAFGNLDKSAKASKQMQKEHVIPDFLEKHAVEMMGEAGQNYFQRMLEGKACIQTELQMHQSEKDSPLIWVRITGTAVFDEQQKVSKLIGKIANIQSEKEKEFALEDARIRDGLTGLYKRIAGVQKIREYMAKKSSEEICGMMLLDMDDFEQVNESEGQVFADAVLQDVAQILRSKTGADDILVRLGGDEFMLFIKNCPKSRATILGPEIAAKILELSGLNNPGPKISASIGMCVTEVVDEYTGLYRCAESTLNYVKEHGKGKAACYMDTSNELGMTLTQMYPGRHLINKIEHKEGVWEDLPAFALDLLGKSKNLDDAIFLLLSRVGKSCAMDRVLVVELNTEYLSCHPMYQWSRFPADRLPEDIIYITREELTEITNCYDSEDLCEKRIITRTFRSNMKSILHSAIWNYGQCVGAISFEHIDSHQWTGDERQLLSDLTKIISSFTLKARADAVSKAKTDFLSRMSHEIRTPMNAITGMTVIAKTIPDTPAKTLDCLNKIESANKYLLSLINDILDMSRIESGKIELHQTSVNVDHLIKNLDALIRPQADSKGLHFEVKNGFSDKRSVLADELRINQVLVNLLGNAVKYTPKGGNIIFEISLISSNHNNVILRFSVTDTGIGISSEAQERIFNAFEQAGSDTASNYGGTGLGLSISSRLVQLMGGSLEVDSEPDKGSSFFFSLCLPYGPAIEEDPHLGILDTSIPFDPTGKRLLLAEDNELNQEIAREILEMHGFIVETANNGKEAVSLFEENNTGYFDAILMDIRMPVLGGMEATRIIRTMGKKDSRTIPIIAMTANAFDEDTKKSLENGMDRHLSKPIDVTELLTTLKSLISSRSNNSSYSLRNPSEN